MSSSQSTTPACSNCRQKKVQCDRGSPSCRRCAKKGLDCLYPATSSRYIVSRERSCRQCRHRRAKCDRKRPCSACAITGVNCTYAADDQENDLPRLSDGTPSYFSPLQRDPSATADIGSVSDLNLLIIHPSMLLGNDPFSVNLTELHPPIGHIWLLWHIFTENVEPLFKLFHAPSVQKQLISAVQNLGSIDGELETLLFAVYFAAIVVQDDAECLITFRQSKLDLLRKYRFALEQCFARSMFLTRPSISSLLALVLFLTMSHYAPLLAPIQSLLALAINLACRLNLHEDTLHHSQTSQGRSNYLTVANRTATEMRRRLWWHIMTIDVECAEFMRADPVISEATWSTRFPGNFDDGELDASSELPVPPPTGETFQPEVLAIQATTPRGAQGNRRTNMSFALLRMEMMHVLRHLEFSEQFSINNGYQYLSTCAARIQFLDELVKGVNLKYLQFRQGNDPLSFFERNAVKLILSKHLMLAKQEESTRDKLHNCVQVLEAAVGMRKTHVRWAWLLRQSVELDSLELLWSCLIVQPDQEQQAENDVYREHAWKLAEGATESGERDGMAACYPSQWSRIRDIYKRAIEIRLRDDNPDLAK